MSSFLMAYQMMLFSTINGVKIQLKRKYCRLPLTTVKNSIKHNRLLDCINAVLCHQQHTVCHQNSHIKAIILAYQVIKASCPLDYH